MSPTYFIQIKKAGNKFCYLPFLSYPSIIFVLTAAFPSVGLSPWGSKAHSVPQPYIYVISNAGAMPSISLLLSPYCCANFLQLLSTTFFIFLIPLKPVFPAFHMILLQTMPDQNLLSYYPYQYSKTAYPHLHLAVILYLLLFALALVGIFSS